MSTKRKPQPKRRKSVTVTDAFVNATPPPSPPMILKPETLADLKYIEPIRARDRLIACLNELYLAVGGIQLMHGQQDPVHD